MEVLNPIQQRLFLYNFAYVQIDPFGSMDTTPWDLPGLQFIPPSGQGNEWRRLFSGLDPYSPVTHYPVISPSLAALRNIRRHQPTRRMIFCQTAFEPVISTKKLVRLNGLNNKLARVLNEADPFRPLYYIGDWPNPDHSWFPPYRRFDRHPMARALKITRAANPESRFFVQEDGTLAQQCSLFSRTDPFEDDAEYRRERENFEHQFRTRIGELEAGAFVFARDKELLAWFRRDSTRLLGKRHYCWAFPQLPDHRDPLCHLILICDGDARFSNLEPRFPQIHLDGGPRDLRYRQMRFITPGQPRWQSRVTPDAAAIFNGGEHQMIFYKTDHGWFSQDTGNEAPDSNEMFAWRVDMLKDLLSL